MKHGRSFHGNTDDLANSKNEHTGTTDGEDESSEVSKDNYTDDEKNIKR